MPKIESDPIFIGIDPGKNGGIVWCIGNILRIHRMPDTERGIWESIALLGSGNSFAQIEWIHPAIQGIAKGGMSKLYGNYMALRMALTAAGIPFEHIMPRKWQSNLGIQSRKKTENGNKWKDRLRNHAQQLFPKLDVWEENLGYQRAVCDALLIAENCRRTHRSKQ